jgi:hypothetical protein
VAWTLFSNSTSCNLWTISKEAIGDSFSQWVRAINAAEDAGDAQYAGGGHWNLLDVLQIGSAGGQDFAEYKAQMMLWAIVASPLIISNDVRNVLSEQELAIYFSRGIAQISQDPLGIQGRRIKVSRTHQRASNTPRETNTNRV